LSIGVIDANIGKVRAQLREGHIVRARARKVVSDTSSHSLTTHPVRPIDPW
jgi:hypothetical protein